MMSGYRWVRKAARIVAFGMLTLAGASSAAWGATQTLVRFSGSIVAPPLQFVSTTRVPQASTTGSLSASATAATVTFAPRPGYDFGAYVSVMAAGEAGPGVSTYLTSRFTDGAGHGLAQGESGRFRVGASGGTLSLALRKGSQVPDGTHVIVVVSYR